MRQTECLFLPYLWETWTYFYSFYKLWHIYWVIHISVQHFLCLCALKKKSECSAHRWAFHDAERGSFASGPGEGIEVLVETKMLATQDPYSRLSAYGLDLISWGFRERLLSASWDSGAGPGWRQISLTRNVYQSENSTCRTAIDFQVRMFVSSRTPKFTS